MRGAKGGPTDPDLDGARNELEFLTGTNPTNVLEVFHAEVQRNQGILEIHFPRKTIVITHVYILTGLPSIAVSSLMVFFKSLKSTISDAE